MEKVLLSSNTTRTYIFVADGNEEVIVIDTSLLCRKVAVLSQVNPFPPYPRTPLGYILWINSCCLLNFSTSGKCANRSIMATDRHESFTNERQYEYIAADVKATDRVNLGLRILIFLLTMGIVSGLVNGSITLALESTSRAIAQLSYLSFPGYVFGYLALVLFATALGKLAGQACGSGLPELKHILAGEMRPADYEQFTSIRVLLVKGFGLIASASVAPLGREGPLVHTSACVTNLLLSKISMFRDIVDSPELCRQCFAASAAVGVASSFNAPVGGLLFSVEVTSTYYLISNYWKSFVAAVAGSIVCNLILMTYTLGGNSSTGMTHPPPTFMTQPPD